MRIDQREPNQLRPLKITPEYLLTAEGSALIEVGNTHVLCAASIEETVPGFLRGTGKGWVTAEYSMLPRATGDAHAARSHQGPPLRAYHEIQRLIGRSMRSVVDIAALGERTVMLDCDVLQADGGTRTAAITGALRRPRPGPPPTRRISARSKPCRCAITSPPPASASCGGVPMLDLCYEEDSQADVDMNVVMTGAGTFVEVQATAEQDAFRRRANGPPARSGAQRHRRTDRNAKGGRPH